MGWFTWFSGRELDERFIMHIAGQFSDLAIGPITDTGPRLAMGG
jgi:hypothetical protein